MFHNEKEKMCNNNKIDENARLLRAAEKQDEKGAFIFAAKRVY